MFSTRIQSARFVIGMSLGPHCDSQSQPAIDFQELRYNVFAEESVHAIGQHPIATGTCQLTTACNLAVGRKDPVPMPTAGPVVRIINSTVTQLEVQCHLLTRYTRPAITVTVKMLFAD